MKEVNIVGNTPSDPRYNDYVIKQPRKPMLRPFVNKQ